ncbi:MAG: beta-galactosidase [Granulosicoccus sp.]
MKTGVCYYPEHWPVQRWEQDASHMRQLGLSHVRIGEFAWSRLEDKQGELHLGWLTDAINVLHRHDLKVVMCTPTATPPRWMLDKYPDMLALDDQLRLRDFGSRRHYCFSHAGYLQECKRIVNILANAYGEHPAVVAWQTDNEYGCHNTSISYSPSALKAFQAWCSEHYSSIESLNTAWGNVFWSMEYDSFEQIGLPTGCVTESNPAHQLAFWRFSSRQIQRFNKAQVDIIRAGSPGRDVLHNFMGNFVEFDHHLVSNDLDVATWDNYPLGFLTRDSFNESDKERYLRTGHPDSSAFHHDLYRGCCNGRWWVMEQQPGPVNWAPYNPSPLPGMVKLWGWEAFAHGAEVMSYFRWRQAPFAQEQTHTGLLLSNGQEDIAASEVAQLNKELLTIDQNLIKPVIADTAIIFSYTGIAIQDIQSPGGEAYSALTFCQDLYSACRRWGLNVDIVSPQAPLQQYKLVLVCNHTEDNTQFAQHLMQFHKEAANATIVLFPGTGSRSVDYTTPASLPPGKLQSLIDIKVVRSESLPPGYMMPAKDTDKISCQCGQWRELIESPLTPDLYFSDGWGFHYKDGTVHYLNALPDFDDLLRIVGELASEARLSIKDLGPDLRTQRIGRYRLAFNYGAQPVELNTKMGADFGFSTDTQLLIGEHRLGSAQVAVWEVE